MTTGASTSARPRWQWLLLQLALSVPELAVAAGLGFAIFTVTMTLGCRALFPICDSTGGLALVVVGLVASILVACAYWIVALGLGLARRSRARYALDAVVAVVGITNVGVLVWHEYSAAAKYNAERAAAESSEAAAREAWIAALRQNPNGHGPPGVVPPMLEVFDEGLGVHVTNMTQEWLTVALARVLQDNQGAWSACPLLTVGENSAYYRFSIGPGHTAQYAPVTECAAGFEGAALEYRVGDPLLDAVGFWSDTAFAVPKGRLP
jgi:hypothetical protein